MLVLLVSSTSCQKFLDTKPTNFITPEYKNIAQLETGLAGVYDVLGSVYSDDWSYWLNATSDIEYDRTGQQTSAIYIYSPADIRITSFWRLLYQGIYRANVILDAVNNPDLPAEKSRIEGETLFLRAYYNFMLVSNFGNVPLLLTADPSISELNIPATPMKDIYDQIVADMIKAEGLVDAAGEGKATFGGRVSKSAVQGILARVYLKMAGYPLNGGSPMYEEALKWATKVKDSGKHELEPDYREIFKRYARDEYDIKESIWEVEYYGNGSGGLQEFSYYTGRVAPLSIDLEIGRSSGLIMASKKLFDLYGGTAVSSPDIRRDWNIAPYSWGGTVPGTYTPIPDLLRRHAGKWRREYETLTPKGNNVSGQNFPVLRYSDVLLMIAEAENELFGPNNAYPYVNEVRKRGFGILHGNTVKSIEVTGGGSGYTSIPTVTVAGGLIKATAVVSGGVVTAINITDYERITKTTGYSVPPAITITGGGATSGATAVAVLTQTTDADLTSIQIASPTALLQAIKDERAREFCFETSRRPDLIRWGNFVSDIRQYAIDGKALGMNDGMVAWTNNVTERSVLFPIPIYDLTLNKALVQNPGY